MGGMIKVTSRGKDEISSLAEMDATYENETGNDEYRASIGHSLNMAALIETHGGKHMRTGDMTDTNPITERT